MCHIQSSAPLFKMHYSSGGPTCAPPDLKCKRARPRPAFSSWGAMSPTLDPAGSPLTYSRCSLGGTGSSSHSAAYGKSVCMRLMRPSFSCTCRLEALPDCYATSGACPVQLFRCGVAHSKGFSCTCRLETMPDCCVSSGACPVQWCSTQQVRLHPWHAHRRRDTSRGLL